MKAIVNVPICALLAAPTRESTLEDEALYGMVVDILEEPAPGWYRVRTHYRRSRRRCLPPSAPAPDRR